MARPRSTKTVVASLFDAASIPIYLLDEKRRIVYANEALAKWIHLPRQELIGLRCDYHSAVGLSDENSLVAGLSPPPGEYRDLATSEVAAAMENGEVDVRSATLVQLHDELKLCGVLVIVGESTIDTKTTNEQDQAHQLLLRIRAQQRDRYQFDHFIGRSPQIVTARERMAVAADSRGRVLVVGSHGSGCEHVARTVYELRHPQGGCLTPLACELLDAELIRNTLDVMSSQRKESLQEGGAILLLDVDRLAEEAQAVLARFLSGVDADFEIFATARAQLAELGKLGVFRDDLAERLSTLVIELPPLAERRSDIPLLVQYGIEQANAKGSKQIRGATAEAIDMLLAYAWPRNVDELFEYVAQACEQASGPMVVEDDLPERIRLAADAARFPFEPDEEIVLDDFLIEIESELITRAMDRAKGNKAQAARLLGLNRARFLRRLEHVRRRLDAPTEDEQD